MEANTIFEKFKSPIGTIYVLVDDNSIYEISTVMPKNGAAGSNEISQKVVKALQNYFENGQDPFLMLKGINFQIKQGTSFQQKVWKELTKIKPGTSLSYGEIAQKVGSPQAYRAVGSAVGKNPFLIVYPCHRVLAANKKIGGFSAGPSKKKFLLKHENLEFIAR